MDNEPNWVVIRAAVGLPVGMIPAGLDGLWIDLCKLPFRTLVFPAGGCVAVPIGQFEVRHDLAIAEVYEVQPPCSSAEAPDA